MENIGTRLTPSMLIIKAAADECEEHIKLERRSISLPITNPACGAEALHPLEFIGIDTCSAMAVLTESLDFLYLNRSEEAVRSVELNGVGGNDSIVGGR